MNKDRPKIRRGPDAQGSFGVQAKIKRFLKKRSSPVLSGGNLAVEAANDCAQASGSKLLNSLADKPDCERSLLPSHVDITPDDSDAEGVGKQTAHSVLRLSNVPRRDKCARIETTVPAPAPERENSSILAYRSIFFGDGLRVKSQTSKKISGQFQSHPGASEERASSELPSIWSRRRNFHKGRRRRYKRGGSACYGPDSTRNQSENQPVFNHYDDGSGFLDGDSLGFDFNSGSTWEGIGCMGMGDSGLEEA